MAAIKSGISIAKIDENRVVIPKSSNRRVAWWRVTLGKKITGSKKVRRFFAKESEAKQFIALTLESKQVEGHEAFILTPSIRAEARQCQEMLDAAAQGGPGGLVSLLDLPAEDRQLINQVMAEGEELRAKYTLTANAV